MHRSVSVAAAVPAATPAAAAAVAVSVTLAGPVVHCLYDDASAVAAAAAAVWLVMAAFEMWVSGGTVCHRPDPVWSWVVAVADPHPAVD